MLHTQYIPEETPRDSSIRICRFFSPMAYCSSQTRGLMCLLLNSSPRQKMAVDQTDHTKAARQTRLRSSIQRDMSPCTQCSIRRQRKTSKQQHQYSPCRVESGSLCAGGSRHHNYRGESTNLKVRRERAGWLRLEIPAIRCRRCLVQSRRVQQPAEWIHCCQRLMD